MTQRQQGVIGFSVGRESLLPQLRHFASNFRLSFAIIHGCLEKIRHGLFISPKLRDESN